MFDHELLELGEMGECSVKMFSPVMILTTLFFI